ncbi:hypothetical protein [Blautia obeum]|uniref:hypothetical protein n=1 Tax=Blautia obeum TaxID=40520 RepID=UPI0034A49818
MINGRISIADAARVLKMDCQTVRLLLRQNQVPWGMAFKRPGSTQYSYLIYAEPFKQLTGFTGYKDGE